MVLGNCSHCMGSGFVESDDLCRGHELAHLFARLPKRQASTNAFPRYNSFHITVSPHHRLLRETCSSDISQGRGDRSKTFDSFLLLGQQLRTRGLESRCESVDIVNRNVPLTPFD
jgi:hypothetical protein